MSFNGITRPVDPVSTSKGTLEPPLTEAFTMRLGGLIDGQRHGPVQVATAGLPIGPVAAEQPAAAAAFAATTGVRGGRAGVEGRSALTACSAKAEQARIPARPASAAS